MSISRNIHLNWYRFTKIEERKKSKKLIVCNLKFSSFIFPSVISCLSSHRPDKKRRKKIIRIDIPVDYIAFRFSLIQKKSVGNRSRKHCFANPHSLESKFIPFHFDDLIHWNNNKRQQQQQCLVHVSHHPSAFFHFIHFFSLLLSFYPLSLIGLYLHSSYTSDPLM